MQLFIIHLIYLRRIKMPRVIDLFCGCGGLSLGFEKAGFQLVRAFDNWDKAVNIYNKNFIDHKAE